ncbi:hypothetical protein [Limnoglobus roseus]|uniref:Uncharacterized protein n=1 Tax=Limnoglobus roseus TaxID=2598579 RepID=A0A5C1AKR8_9BACT|nr:hypothetical protein [Limnoglobus roseus]QEL19265.1 hypothetical protein PX52LOC_06327 [Limnoglobus roseus]
MPTDPTRRPLFVGVVALALAVATLSAVVVVAVVDLLDLPWWIVQEVISRSSDSFRATSVTLVVGVAVTSGPAFLAERRGGRDRTFAHLAGACVAVAVAAWLAVVVAAVNQKATNEREQRKAWEKYQSLRD